jgi:hypothetical protein
VPDTLTQLPILTAREYPTIGSHCVPLEMFCRDTSISFAALASRKRMLNLLNCGTPLSPMVLPACLQLLTPRWSFLVASASRRRFSPRAGELYDFELHIEQPKSRPRAKDRS